MSAEQYIATLLNPFDSTFAQPKILDGSEPRSAGVRFRNVGNLTLPVDGSPQLIVLFPGFSYCLNWKTPAGAPSMHTVNPSHLESLAQRTNVRKVRLVITGLKLSLENTSDDNEGSWEAIRIPIQSTDFSFTDATVQTAEDFGVKLRDSFNFTNLANHTTYQTGRLRDLHRFLFKLNSVDPDHDFIPVTPYTATTDPLWDTTASASLFNDSISRLLDKAFDVVVIRVTGRIDAVSPSVLRYDLVSNQEVVYKDDTALGRLMTLNVMLPQMNVLLDKTRFQLPSIQVA